MEFVTALRGTFDDGKPSLFELLSEQQLASLLPPTLRYLLRSSRTATRATCYASSTPSTSCTPSPAF